MSYNGLTVPLAIGSWSCELVPVDDYRSPSGEWLRFASGEERKQIEDDRRTFERHFRPSYDFRRTIRTDVDAIRSFLSQHLNVAHWNLPVDNASIERVLKRAVSEGSLVPIVERDGRAAVGTARAAHAPQYWRAPYRGSGGGSVMASPREKTFHQSVMESMGLSADAATAYIVKYNAMVERLNAAQDARAAANRLRALTDDGIDGAGLNEANPLGDAKPFAYTPDPLSDDATQIAARGVSEADEAECLAQYERELDLCRAVGAAMGGLRGKALCEQNAFNRYQQCRGY
ncbi:hypothetical protein [Paraburkholderia bannensis]|uniref:hypothetical protein n=1 Tax=Paraburkholderia bannensis TaxID=765414 RepID=UPI002AB644D7|nr:hypothetical protein [Paraburkholderia bannensis]